MAARHASMADFHAPTIGNQASVTEIQRTMGNEPLARLWFSEDGD
jgi:hypothetical protein